MTSGLDNLSLALFTALAPAGVVAFIIMALARLFAIDHERAVRIDRMIALPFAVALVGFIASQRIWVRRPTRFTCSQAWEPLRFPTRCWPP